MNQVKGLSTFLNVPSSAVADLTSVTCRELAYISVSKKPNGNPGTNTMWCVGPMGRWLRKFVALK